MYTSPTTDSFIDRLLARNREWADGLRRLNPDTLKYLADHGQKPQVRTRLDPPPDDEQR